MISLIEIVLALQQTPELLESIDLSTVYRFIDLLASLKRAILHHRDLKASHDPKEPPLRLPSDIAVYICQRLATPVIFVCGLWNALRTLIWTTGRLAGMSEELRMHDELDGRFAYSMLYPTVEACMVCGNQALLRHKDEPRKVSLYTLASGVRDALSIHLYCHSCKTNHHHNYAVHKGLRIYYPGVPDIIQVSEHDFVERQVLELFRSLALFAWTSATNAAHIYHHSLSRLTEEHKTLARLQLRTEHVWDGFVLLSLLRDAEARMYTLELPHTGDQRDRFTAAMQARNTHIQQFGQPEFTHFCDKCVRTYENKDGSTGYVDVVVTDGIEMGRPCCSVRHCRESLVSECTYIAPLLGVDASPLLGFGRFGVFGVCSRVIHG